MAVGQERAAADSEAQSPHEGKSGLRVALAQRSFRWYWIGMFGLAFATEVQRFSFPWLAYYLTESTIMVGLVGLFLGLPALVLTPFGGVLADRAGRGAIIRITLAAALAGSAALALLLLVFGEINVWIVLGFAALSGALSAFDGPARQAIVPGLVPRSALLNAMALTSSAWSISRIAGPAVAGVLLAVLLAWNAGPGGVFLTAAAGYGLIYLCMRQVQVPPLPPRASNQSVLREMAEGFRYIGRDRLVRILFVIMFVNSTFGMSYLLIMPVFAAEVFEVDTTGLGLMVSSVGIGALLGTFLLASTGGFQHRGRVLIVTSVLFGVALIAFALSVSFVMALIVLLLSGGIASWYQTNAHTLLQMIVPDAVRGRVMGTYTLIWALAPLGAAILGAMAAVWSAPTAVAIGGTVVVVVTLVSAVLVREMRAVTA